MASTDANSQSCDRIEPSVTKALKAVAEVTSDATKDATYYWNPDTPADEMTISVDHIREQLFSKLTPQDLFNCRRLNRQWNSYATAELQERFELKCTITGGNLEEYLNLLQKHQEIFPFSPLPIFRKSSFEKATLDILSDPMLEKFLRTYGYFIHDLSLIQKSGGSSEDILPTEKVVMEKVRTLLIHSAPNLSSLRMWGMDLQVDWNWKEDCTDRYQVLGRTLRTTDPEYFEIHSIPDTEKNENLKIFSFNQISGKMFELAIQLAPNLEEIEVRSYEKDKDQDHKYFIEPLNRLRFCKDMKYCSDTSDLFKKFAKLAQEGNLKLRNFSFMFGMEDPSIDCMNNLHPEFSDSYGPPDLDAINRLLACSFDSLETITWRWVMGVRGLKWPEVMPNVWRINLGPCHYTLPNGFLPFRPDFSWSKRFPKLRHLRICEVVHSSNFSQLLRCFRGQCIDSVEEVHVLAENSEERDATTLANFEQLRGLFPSAQVLSTWPFTD